MSVLVTYVASHFLGPIRVRYSYYIIPGDPIKYGRWCSIFGGVRHRLWVYAYYITDTKLSLSLSHTPILNKYMCVCITVSDQCCMDRKRNRNCEGLICNIKSTDFQSNTLFLSSVGDKYIMQSSRCSDMKFIDCIESSLNKNILLI